MGLLCDLRYEGLLSCPNHEDQKRPYKTISYWIICVGGLSFGEEFVAFWHFLQHRFPLHPPFTMAGETLLVPLDKASVFPSLCCHLLIKPLTRVTQVNFWAKHSPLSSAPSPNKLFILISLRFFFLLRLY